jgi:hypothetical protein
MKLNLDNLNDSINKALSIAAFAVADASTEAIETERWDWDNETTRSDGSVVGTPRDIVDTGKLRDSQTVTIGDTSITIEYTADHAAVVHSRRPFLATALKETDVAKKFTNALKDELK